jgi:hypothetical protein
MIDASIQGVTHQAIALLAQAAAVQNTWYTVLDTTLNCRVIGVCVAMSVAIETLQMRITIDGNILSGEQAAAVVGTIYHGILLQTNLAQNLTMTSTVPLTRSFLLEGRSVKVEVRKTTAVGAGTLTASVVYAKR